MDGAYLGVCGQTKRHLNSTTRYAQNLVGECFATKPESGQFYYLVGIKETPFKGVACRIYVFMSVFMKNLVSVP